MSRPVKAEHLEELRSMLKAAQANGIGSAKLKEHGVHDSTYYLFLKGKCGLGLSQANKMRAGLGLAPWGDEVLGPFHTGGAEKRRRRGRPPAKQGSLFDPGPKKPRAPAVSYGSRELITKKADKALRDELITVAGERNLSWMSLERLIFPDSRQVYLSRYMNQKLPPVSSRGRADQIWQGLRRLGGAAGPPPWSNEVAASTPVTESEQRRKARHGPVAGAGKLSGDQLLAKMTPKTGRGATHQLRIAAIHKLRDDFGDDRPAMANALGMTTSGLTRYLHGSSLGPMETEALTRLLGPADKFPVRNSQIANVPTPQAVTAAVPPATMREFADALGPIVADFVSEIGRQTLLYYLNQQKPK